MSFEHIPRVAWQVANSTGEQPPAKTGPAVGMTVGLKEGFAVGTLLGDAVGIEVGVFVGSCE